MKRRWRAGMAASYVSITHHKTYMPLTDIIISINTYMSMGLVVYAYSVRVVCIGVTLSAYGPTAWHLTAPACIVPACIQTCLAQVYQVCAAPPVSISAYSVPHSVNLNHTM